MLYKTLINTVVLLSFTLLNVSSMRRETAPLCDLKVLAKESLFP